MEQQRQSRVENGREVERNGKPVTVVGGLDNYDAARRVANLLRAGRSLEERRAGMEYRIVAAPAPKPGEERDTRSYVERFYNW